MEEKDGVIKTPSEMKKTLDNPDRLWYYTITKEKEKEIKEMRKYTKMMDEMHKMERAMIEEQREALNKIINELANYPIAMNDRHYDFLQMIQKELEDFRNEL